MSFRFTQLSHAFTRQHLLVIATHTYPGTAKWVYFDKMNPEQLLGWTGELTLYVPTQFAEFNDNETVDLMTTIAKAHNMTIHQVDLR